MDEPFIGQIITVGFNFAPPGWLPCDGRLLNIDEYQTLYTAIGTTYGGNGSTNFALPNLCGTISVGAGQGQGLSGYALGQVGGTESVTLTAAQVPLHGHAFLASSAPGTTNTPDTNLVAAASGRSTAPYSTAAPSIGMSPQALQPSTGGGQAHENRQPFLCLLTIIATQGVFPT